MAAETRRRGAPQHAAPPRGPEAGPQDAQRSEFLGSLKKGMLIGAAVLVLVVPALRMAKQQGAPQQPPAPQVGQAMPSESAPERPSRPRRRTPPPRPPAPPRGVLADFNGEQPSRIAQLVANWVVATQDHQKHAFVIIDKKDARVYVFSPEGKLKDSAPALLGAGTARCPSACPRAKTRTPARPSYRVNESVLLRACWRRRGRGWCSRSEPQGASLAPLAAPSIAARRACLAMPARDQRKAAACNQRPFQLQETGRTVAVRFLTLTA